MLVRTRGGQLRRRQVLAAHQGERRVRPPRRSGRRRRGRARQRRDRPQPRGNRGRRRPRLAFEQVGGGERARRCDRSGRSRSTGSPPRDPRDARSAAFCAHGAPRRFPAGGRALSLRAVGDRARGRRRAPRVRRAGARHAGEGDAGRAGVAARDEARRLSHALPDRGRQGPALHAKPQRLDRTSFRRSRRPWPRCRSNRPGSTARSS